MSTLTFRCRHRYPSGVELDLAFDTSARVTALCGPSGSGKSTTLALVCGLLTPSEGSITLDGQPLCDTSRRINLPPERRQIGFVMQDLQLFPHLSVAGNLRYGLQRRRRASGPEMNFDKVVGVLELGPLIERRPQELSSGQRQRVALGRALLSRPRLLLMDEPLAALDEPLQLRLLDYLEEIVKKWNVPTLYATHSVSEVRRLAQRVVVIERGRCTVAGSTDGILAGALPQAWNNGLGPINLVRVTQVHRDQGNWFGQFGTARVQLPPLDNRPKESMWIEFASRDVMLSRGESPPAVSARNRLAGTVQQVIEHAGVAYVAVDVGQIVWAQVTPQAVRELELQPGAPAICLIKTQALKVIG